MAVSDETRRSLDRDADGFCRAFATPVPTLSKTSEAPVVAVHGDGTLDVGYGGAVLTVRMTTACAGVAVGDTVLLTAYGQMLYATGILARDDRHSVPRHGTLDASSDWDDISIENGAWAVAGLGSGAPSGVFAWGVLMHFATAGGAAVQIYFPAKVDSLYFRTRYSQTWSEWYKR